MSTAAHAMSARDPTVLLTTSSPKASPENPAHGLDPDAKFSWCASGGFAIGMHSGGGRGGCLGFEFVFRRIDVDSASTTGGGDPITSFEPLISEQTSRAGWWT